MTITAYHYGWVEFRLCPEGGRGADGHGVTQECFNQHVLRFDVADAAARYTGSMDSKGAQDPSDYVGTQPSSRCDGPGAELKLEGPRDVVAPGHVLFRWRRLWLLQLHARPGRALRAASVLGGPRLHAEALPARRAHVLPGGAVHAAVDVHDWQHGGWLPRGVPQLRCQPPPRRRARSQPPPRCRPRSR